MSARDELAGIIHEVFNRCRGRNGVDPKVLADAILANWTPQTVTEPDEREVRERVAGALELLDGLNQDGMKYDHYSQLHDAISVIDSGSQSATAWNERTFDHNTSPRALAAWDRYKSLPENHGTRDYPSKWCVQDAFTAGFDAALSVIPSRAEVQAEALEEAAALWGTERGPEMLNGKQWLLDRAARLRENEVKS